LGVVFASAMGLWSGFHPGADGYAFEFALPLGLQGIGSSLSLGLNAISLPMFVLTAVVGLAAGFLMTDIKRERAGLIWGLVLIAQGGMLGAFACMDLFYAFFLHEIALLPTFIALVAFGGADRRHAATEVGISMLAGSLLVLAGLLALYFGSGVHSFNLVDLRGQFEGGGALALGWGMLLLGTAILIGLWPFHSWVVRLLECAPTPFAMLHAGAIKFFGIYFVVQGFLWALPPEGWGVAGVVAKVLAVVALVGLALAALEQKDLKRIFAYLALVHVGTFVLAVVSLKPAALTGLILAMLGGGLALALVFALAGRLEHRLGTTDIDKLGGLRARMGKWSAFFMGGALALIALPGFVNFWGELGMLIGIAERFPLLAVGVGVSLGVCAVLVLRILTGVLMGEDKQPRAELPDLSRAEFCACAMLLALLVGLMLFPASVTLPLAAKSVSVLPFYL
jgi:NADH-quinone oxidoreductase subunit M